MRRDGEQARQQALRTDFVLPDQGVKPGTGQDVRGRRLFPQRFHVWNRGRSSSLTERTAAIDHPIVAAPLGDRSLDETLGLAPQVIERKAFAPYIESVGSDIAEKLPGSFAQVLPRRTLGCEVGAIKRRGGDFARALLVEKSFIAKRGHDRPATIEVIRRQLDHRLRPRRRMQKALPHGG